MQQQQKNPNFMTQIQEIVNASGGQRPASTIVRDVEIAAMVSKLVQPRERSMFRVTSQDSSSGLLNTGVQQISKSIMGRVEDNENVFRLFPDIELAAQIVISSILSPKDMVKSELIYRVKESGLPPQMTAKMVKIVKSALDTDYKLQSSMHDILREALFESGSSVKVILPEAAVDQLINRAGLITTESIVSADLFTSGDMKKLRGLGYLGSAKPSAQSEKEGRLFSLESALNGSNTAMYEAALYIPPARKESTDEWVDMAKLAEKMVSALEVSDNFHFLKMPKLLDAIGERNAARLGQTKLKARATKFATETMDASLRKEQEKISATSAEMGSMLYKSSKTDYRPFMLVPGKMSLMRRSVGKPLLLNIPSEAAIPVHVPGDPTDHIGYFVPNDMDGNPVTVNSRVNDPSQGLGGMMQANGPNAALGGLLTEKARNNLAGDSVVPMIDHITDIYADLIENDLMERFVKGAYGKKVQISRNNEIYRIMLARTFQSQFTRLIYIPKEYVTYFAFNYHRNGVGKSYLDDLTNITSMRAMALFSKVMAKVKSSISTTSVNVAFDPRDPDPLKTLEQAKHLVARARQQYFPHGLNRVVDLTDWIQRAGIEITFTGHPRLPDTKFEFESKNIQHVEPDDTLDEMFRHQTYMHFGLSPETVDSAARAEFATTIQQNSILFARRISMLSEIFTKKLTEYAQKIVSNDEVLLAELAEVMNDFKGDIEKNMSDEDKELYNNDPAGFTSYALQSFVDLLELDLPKPDSTRTDGQLRDIQAYEQVIDKGLDFIFSEGVVPAELAGQANGVVKAVREAWKAAKMRAWMADNNYAPELFEIANRGDDDKAAVDLLEMTKGYTEDVMLNIVSFIKELRPARIASDKDLEKMGVEGSGSDYSSSSSSSSYDEGGGDGGGGDFENDPSNPDASTPFDDPLIGGDGGGGGSDGENAPDSPSAGTPFDEVPTT